MLIYKELISKRIVHFYRKVIFGSLTNQWILYNDFCITYLLIMKNILFLLLIYMYE